MNRSLYWVGNAIIALGAVNGLFFANSVFGLLYSVILIQLGITVLIHGRTE